MADTASVTIDVDREFRRKATLTFRVRVRRVWLLRLRLAVFARIVAIAARITGLPVRVDSIAVANGES